MNTLNQKCKAYLNNEKLIQTAMINNSQYIVPARLKSFRRAYGTFTFVSYLIIYQYDAPKGAVSNRPFRVGIWVGKTNIDNSKSPIGGDILVIVSSKGNFVYDCRYSYNIN